MKGKDKGGGKGRAAAGGCSSALPVPEDDNGPSPYALPDTPPNLNPDTVDGLAETPGKDDDGDDDDGEDGVVHLIPDFEDVEIPTVGGWMKITRAELLRAYHDDEEGDSFESFFQRFHQRIQRSTFPAAAAAAAAQQQQQQPQPRASESASGESDIILPPEEAHVLPPSLLSARQLLIQRSDTDEEKKDMGGEVGMQAEVLLGTAAPGYRDRALKWPFEC